MRQSSTIYSRKELIEPCGLVGATRFAIAMPIIIEGMLEGFVGGLIGDGGIYLIKALFTYEQSLRMIPISWGPVLLPAVFPLYRSGVRLDGKRFRDSPLAGIMCLPVLPSRNRQMSHAGATARRRRLKGKSVPGPMRSIR